ncbi:MAG TPA: haloperoxidase, partial [Thermoanaerobaculia bacterium]|nr:haloperoxidase [Thermoanaerobaculia bacterium]
TEPNIPTAQMQALEGVLAKDVAETAAIDLALPTFSATAEMAAESRMLGGYHIRSDNDDGLRLGRQLAEFVFPRYRAYWEGTTAGAK